MPKKNNTTQSLVSWISIVVSLGGFVVSWVRLEANQEWIRARQGNITQTLKTDYVQNKHFEATVDGINQRFNATVEGMNQRLSGVEGELKDLRSDTRQILIILQRQKQ